MGGRLLVEGDISDKPMRLSIEVGGLASATFIDRILRF